MCLSMCIVVGVEPDEVILDDRVRAVQEIISSLLVRHDEREESSNVQFLVTSGIPMATRPHPSRGTFFNWALAKYLQYPSILALMARCWIM